MHCKLDFDRKCYPSVSVQSYTKGYQYKKNFILCLCITSIFYYLWAETYQYMSYIREIEVVSFFTQ